MAISPYEFWYDRQMVRMLEQVVRAFSGFSYQTGSINGAPPQTIMVPCRMASTNRMVANLMTNLTENALLSVPLITVYQTGLRGRREDVQNPVFVDHRQVFERNIRPDGTYGPDLGNRYSVDRLMPMPFLMEVSIDIWTSNLQQKYMLIEQILPVIYPQFQIQNSDNALDWTAVSICVVDDDFTFSSRTVPIGTTDEIDIMSIHVKIPIWLSAPAKVKNLKRVEEIITNIHTGAYDPNTGKLEMGTPLKQIIVTPEQATISVDGAVITLVAAADTPTGALPSWADLLNEYGGTLVAQNSMIKLFTDGNNFVTGTLAYGAQVNQLSWTLDPASMPINTLAPVNAVIDPQRSYPGSGNLPAAQDGQRYLLISDIGTSAAWNVNASANDIIQYAGGNWTVVFDASTVQSTQYVMNGFTGRQLRWTGTGWVVSIDGVYHPGQWRLIMTPVVDAGILADTNGPWSSHEGVPVSEA